VSLLALDGVAKSFGGVRAVAGVSFQLAPGEIVGLIGPNGAGKTTLVNLICGVERADAGTISFVGTDVTGQRPFQAARRGLSRTFQIVQPFPAMSVLENVTAGALFAGRAANRRQAEAEAREHLAFVGLTAAAVQPAAALTLPDRKRLELAKALAMRPKLVLLDEVNAGLNPTEIAAAVRLIRAIAERGITVLLIEHLMQVVTALSRRVLVLHHGELIGEGPPAEILADPRVVEAYLGARFADRQRRRGHG
jgi:branched-chain amino acid transport system ATP-binding protein